MKWYIVLAGCVMVTISGAPPQKDYINQYLREPKVLALLDTIAFAEGTDIPCAKSKSPQRGGYGTRFGSELVVTDFSEFPQGKTSLKRNGKTLSTSASGRYQIQKSTWKEASGRANEAFNGDSSFSPYCQDRAAVYLAHKTGAIDALMKEHFMLSEVFALLGKCWASMPGSKWGFVHYDTSYLARVFNTRFQVYASRTHTVAV